MESMKSPFEASLREIQNDPAPFIDSVFDCLKSEFLVLPKGPSFIEYKDFEAGYERLKAATRGFADLSPAIVLETVIGTPISLVVLRTMLGFTPPEWAAKATEMTDVAISQGAARTIDKRARVSLLSEMTLTGVTARRVRALIESACRLLESGPAPVSASELHRLDKADTRAGIASLRNAVSLEIPYAMLLYERLLGRPFAGHRDSVSDLVGAGFESLIADVLEKAGVSFRQTGRAEAIPGFDQAPDFIGRTS